jgi:hypothetical protein
MEEGRSIFASPSASPGPPPGQRSGRKCVPADPLTEKLQREANTVPRKSLDCASFRTPCPLIFRHFHPIMWLAPSVCWARQFRIHELPYPIHLVGRSSGIPPDPSAIPDLVTHCSERLAAFHSKPPVRSIKNVSQKTGCLRPPVQEGSNFDGWGRLSERLCEHKEPVALRG